MVNNKCLVNVKWGKEVFKQVEVDLTEDVMTFRSQMYCLSNVPVDKQKILVKGKQIKDADDLKTFKLKKDQTIMMMGVAEGQGLKEPEKAKVFWEDMTPEQ